MEVCKNCGHKVYTNSRQITLHTKLDTSVIPPIKDSKECKECNCINPIRGDLNENKHIPTN